MSRSSGVSLSLLVSDLFTRNVVMLVSGTRESLTLSSSRVMTLEPHTKPYFGCRAKEGKSVKTTDQSNTTTYKIYFLRLGHA